MPLDTSGQRGYATRHRIVRPQEKPGDVTPLLTPKGRNSRSQSPAVSRRTPTRGLSPAKGKTSPRIGSQKSSKVQNSPKGKIEDRPAWGRGIPREGTPLKAPKRSPRGSKGNLLGVEETSFGNELTSEVGELERTDVGPSDVSSIHSNNWDSTYNDINAANGESTHDDELNTLNKGISNVNGSLDSNNDTLNDNKSYALNNGISNENESLQSKNGTSNENGTPILKNGTSNENEYGEFNTGTSNETGLSSTMSKHSYIIPLIPDGDKNYDNKSNSHVELQSPVLSLSRSVSSNKKVMESEAGPSSRVQRSPAPANSILMTFVGRRAGVKHVKKSLQETLEKAYTVMPKKGKVFNICENYDTYQKGGLYPLLHVCGDTSAVDQYQEEDDFAEQDALGAGLIVDQAVYREVSHIEPPQRDDVATDSVITVAAFRSVDTEPSITLQQNWKSWTGARAYMMDMLEAGVDCQQMTFYARERPLLTDEDSPGFYYVLVSKVGIREPSDEGRIVDVLQRFRVERWFGYQTIYKAHNA